MPSLLRIASHCLILLALIATAAPTAPLVAPLAAPPATEPRLASLPPHVRLLKLHLVRPDLIPYPIAYEVCC